MISRVFGYIDGKEIKEYTLTNGVVKADIITYGGTIRSFGLVENGKFTDIALGYETVEEYAKNAGYLGALIGRVGNRTGDAKFVLNGKEYNVGKNDGKNSLHGGIKGFNAKVWDDRVDGETLYLTYRSVDGEEGYPGNMDVTVAYSINEDNGLKIEYSAVSDADTVINLTNHVYFNLNGQGKGDIYNINLMIDADSVTPVDDGLICTGEFLPVENTPYDFRKTKKIGLDIECKHPQMKICDGYDLNYALNGEGFRKIAEASSDITNIKLSVYTDQKGVQFYSGNFLAGAKGKDGAVYNKRNGFCLETQNYPNAINRSNFPTAILKKGEKYHTVTVYKLSK